MKEARGWVFFDGACSICSSGAERFHRIVHALGYGLVPQQTPWAQQRLGLVPGAPLVELKVLTHTGQIVGGVDALVYLGLQVWWAWPVAQITRLPGIYELSKVVYRWIARNRMCANGACRLPHPSVELAISLGGSLLHPLRQAGDLASTLSLSTLPVKTWSALAAVGFGGLYFFGASLAVLFPGWTNGHQALWITLYTGLSGCLVIPMLTVLTRQRFLDILHVCLVTMAYGSVVLVIAACFNLAAHGRALSFPAVAFNSLMVVLSNLVMALLLARQLQVIGTPLLKTLFLWTLFFGSSEALLYWLFK